MLSSLIGCELFTDTDIVDNNKPVARSSGDQTVYIGATVQLDGSTSSDTDGDTLTYLWSIVSAPDGSFASISDTTLVNPIIVPNITGTYTFQLIVNDGTINSAADTVIIEVEDYNLGTVSNFLYLDGTGYGEITYNSNLDLSNKITIEAKVYVSVFDSATGSVWRRNESSEIILPIISQSHSGSSVGDYTLALTPTRALFAFETVDSRYSVDYAFEAGTWYHVALIHTLGNGNETKIYINGVAYKGVWKGDDGSTLDGNDMSIPNTRNSYFIGNNGNGSDSGMFKGYIDEIRIWDDIRTGSEILSNMDSEVSTNDNNLVSLWNFNIASTGVVEDQKNSNNVQLIAGAITSDTTADN